MVGLINPAAMATLTGLSPSPDRCSHWLYIAWGL